MDRLKSTLRVAVGLVVLGIAGSGFGQAASAPKPPVTTGQASTPGQAAKPSAPAPLQLRSLDSATQADPFPPTNPANFTADSPSAATVESYLHTMLGYDPNRIWKVAAIQKTPAPGVSKVTAFITERKPNAQMQRTMFYVLPDGKHLIAPDSSALNPFGAEPFAENRAMIKARAAGPALGPAAKDLMFVEFADLQCPHCKEAQPTMQQLAKDFPKARIVYENLPLTQIHPYAFVAAAYGACVAKKSSDAFFTYAQAVYDTQGALLPDSYEKTLKDAVVKAGADPTSIAMCAATDTAKNEIAASVKLAADLGVEQTPTLVVNGRPLPLTGIPYDILKQVIAFQAGVDGVQGAAPANSLTLQPR